MGYLKSGGYMIIWGNVTQDAKFRFFESGKCVANFPVKYDTQDAEGQGRKKGRFIDISAWGETGKYASGLEKGDTVLVAGRMQKDDYKSQKNGEDVYLLNAEMVLVQPLAAFGEAGDEIDSPASSEGSHPAQSSAEDGELPF